MASVYVRFVARSSSKLLIPVATSIIAAVATNPCSRSHCYNENNNSPSTATKRSSKGDPLACGNPICSDKMNMFNMAKEQMKSTGQTAVKGGRKSDHPTSSPVLPINANSVDEVNNNSQLQCPLDKNELGRSTWNLLHTMAAYFPESPTEVEQMAVKQLILSLSLLYPCPHCAEDFRESVKNNPPR